MADSPLDSHAVRCLPTAEAWWHHSLPPPILRAAVAYMFMCELVSELYSLACSPRGVAWRLASSAFPPSSSWGHIHIEAHSPSPRQVAPWLLLAPVTAVRRVGVLFQLPLQVAAF